MAGVATRLLFTVGAIAQTAQAVLIPKAYGHRNWHLSAVSLSNTQNCTTAYQTIAGDTCGSIAAKYAMPYSSFIEINQNASCYENVQLTPDELVCIQQTNATNVSCNFSYTLQKGDSCTEVGDLFGISTSTLFDMNPHLDCVDSSTFVGEKICLTATVTNNSTAATVVLGGQSTTASASKNDLNITTIASCTHKVSLTNSTAKGTCVDFAAANNISVSDIAAWNTGIDCWNLAAFSGQSICVSATTSFIPTATTNSAPSASTISIAISATTTTSPLSISSAEASPSPSPSPSPTTTDPPVQVQTTVDVPAPTTTTTEAAQTDPCSAILSIAAGYSASDSPNDALNLINQIRSYLGLSSYSWSSDLVNQAYTDAVYSVDNADCQAGGLVHDPDFGVALAKALGFGDFIDAIDSFISYDDGAGSECFQYFNDGVTDSHFGFMVGGYSQVGCSAADCPGGSPVIGCDYN